MKILDLDIKYIVLAMAAMAAPAFTYAECIAFDYAELKDMSPSELSKAYCSNQVKAKQFQVDSDSEKTFADGLNKANELYFEMERSEQASTAMDKAKKYASSADACAAQGERISRVFAQKSPSSPKIECPSGAEEQK